MQLDFTLSEMITLRNALEGWRATQDFIISALHATPQERSSARAELVNVSTITAKMR